MGCRELRDARAATRILGRLLLWIASWPSYNERPCLAPLLVVGGVVMTRAPDPAEVRALELAREAVAKFKDADGATHTAAGVRAGQYDDITEVRYAYAGALAALASATEAPPVAGMGELDIQALASVIHDARFVNGRETAQWVPFEDENHAGKVYCLRIADAVELHLLKLAPSLGGQACDIGAELRAFAMNMRRDDTDARSDDLRFYYEAIEGFADQLMALSSSHSGEVERIIAGLKAWCSNTPDIDLSPAMMRDAAEHIIGQPLTKPTPPASVSGEVVVPRSVLEWATHILLETGEEGQLLAEIRQLLAAAPEAATPSAVDRAAIALQIGQDVASRTVWKPSSNNYERIRQAASAGALAALAPDKAPSAVGEPCGCAYDDPAHVCDWHRKHVLAAVGGVDRMREALGFDPLDFVAEGRLHALDMPRCIQRDYLNAALDRIECAALTTGETSPERPSASEVDHV
jgi:hypothetical protein